MIKIGITGTYGKTSMGYYLNYALSNAGYKTVFCATWHTYFGLDKTRKSGNFGGTTTPTPKELALYEDRIAAADFLIVELSSDGMRQNRMDQYAPFDICILTGTKSRSTHEFRSGGREKYLAEKKRVFCPFYLSKYGVACYPADDNISPDITKRSDIQHLSFSEFSPLVFCNAVLSYLGVAPLPGDIQVPGRYHQVIPGVIVDKADQPYSYEWLASQLSRDFPGQPVQFVMPLSPRISYEARQLKLDALEKSGIGQHIILYEQWGSLEKRNVSPISLWMDSRESAFAAALKRRNEFPTVLIGNGDQPQPGGTDLELAQNIIMKEVP